MLDRWMAVTITLSPPSLFLAAVVVARTGRIQAVTAVTPVFRVFFPVTRGSFEPVARPKNRNGHELAV